MLYAPQRLHGSLLQKSHQAMDTETHDSLDTTQMPLALREAAFFESADCYTAMIANREVPNLCTLWHAFSSSWRVGAVCELHQILIILNFS